MIPALVLPMAERLRVALADLNPDADAGAGLHELVRLGLDHLPLPGSGATLQRWRALAVVAEHDLSLAKLYEGHTDAKAILFELGQGECATPGSTWGMWAAEAPAGRAIIEPGDDGRLQLRGAKCWCSGAGKLSHGLLTAWLVDGRGPQLVRVAMDQSGVTVNSGAWQAVGMAGSASIDVVFEAANAEPAGALGGYLSRPGFWQGGAGIAACWYGGAVALGSALHRSLMRAGESERRAFPLAALGKIDLSLRSTAAILREAARWIDDHPLDDASAVALRARLAAEDTAKRVLDEAGRALGAAAFCHDARFARTAADLPVFVRQSHAERDFAALGERTTMLPSSPWLL